MEVGIVSMRYAKALLQFAVESHSEDEVYAEMQLLSACLNRIAGFRQTLDNPVLDARRKFELLATAAGTKPGKVYVQFMKLVLKRKREEYIHTICLMYIDLYRKLKNITVGHLITACPVSEEVIGKIRLKVHAYTQGEVEFVTHVDSEIEGGFIFQVDSYRLDASVSDQLRRIKQQFMEKNRRIV